MSKINFKIGDRVVFNWRKWAKEKRETTVRYSVEVASIVSDTDFKGKNIRNTVGHTGTDGTFIAEYFTKEPKRDARGRFKTDAPIGTAFLGGNVNPSNLQIGKFYGHKMWPGVRYLAIGFNGYNRSNELQGLLNMGGDKICGNLLVVPFSFNPGFWGGFYLIKD